MATFTAHATFDSRTVAEFSASTTGLTISRDSEIGLSDATDSSFTATFIGAFAPVDAQGSYGKAEEVSFYSADTLLYTITGNFELEESEGVIGFPDTSGFAALKLFQGSDTYIGSTGNDYFSVYDNRGKNIHYGLEGNDYLELATKGRGVAAGGNGNDLIVSSVAGDKLSGGNGNDFFWLAAGSATITDFSAADDKLVLLKSPYEEKVMKDWLDGKGGTSPVDFTVNANGNFTITSAFVTVIEGLKSARDPDDYFVYDLGSGKLYFDQDGAGGKKPTVLASFTSKPLLTADEIAGSLLFAPHVESFRDYWLETYSSPAVPEV